MKKLRKSSKNRTVLFKVTYLGQLGVGWGEEVSRVIELKETQTLNDLHEAIQRSLGWTDPHLYSFFMDGKKWGDSDQEYVHPQLHKHLQGKRALLYVDYMWYPGIPETMWYSGPRTPKSADAKIQTLGLRKGRRFLYLFDYGDQHHFKVKVIGFGEVKKGEKYPKLLESIGKSPPQYPR